MNQEKILLFGPAVNLTSNKAYGGGTGGYTRKMMLYLNGFKSQKFQLISCFHTVRGEGIALGFVGRFFIDGFRFVKAIQGEQPVGVHILGQYRSALPREFLVVLLAKIWKLPYLYEIKAGVFIEWYQSTNVIFRMMIKFLIKNASVVLGQGQPYIDFLLKELGVKAVYYPNFVAKSEIAPFQKKKFDQDKLKVLFVGYAFRDKGIFELVKACVLLADKIPIELTIVGAEHPDFKQWADQIPEKSTFTLKRLGRLPHREVLNVFKQNTIYCYPSNHKGEGHNNTINEAMMSGLIIITSRIGFLESIIGKERGYLLDLTSVEAIQQKLEYVYTHQAEALEKTIKARAYLEKHFIDRVAFAKLEKAYFTMLNLTPNQ